uniref:Uncharacterized protein n=1 Tax=Anguilla anguilla TaxID=7936 RepID=A0A0E9UUZ4_ANGAN
MSHPRTEQKQYFLYRGALNVPVKVWLGVNENSGQSGHRTARGC